MLTFPKCVLLTQAQQLEQADGTSEMVCVTS